MPLSSMTAFPFIAEGSEATPGLWNASWSIISQNIQELNTKAIGLASGLVLNGSGDPNSNITAGVGFIYEQIDSTSSVHPLWVKKIGSGNTGWFSDAGFMGDAGDGQGAIQVGKQASAQALNSLALAASAAVGANANQGVAVGFGSTVTGSAGVGVGAATQVYSPNGVGIGVNAYVGFRDAGAFGSNVTSNATGAYTLGAYGINSHQSSILLTTTGGSSVSTGALYVDMMSIMSAKVEIIAGTQPRLVLNSTNSATTDAAELIFAKGENFYWRLGQNETSQNDNRLEVYSDLMGAAAMSFSTRNIVSVVSKLDLSTASVSVSTYASATAIPSGCIGVVQRASGLSFVFKSGSTVYVLATSSTSGTA